jgi:hypothetical protein
LVALALELLVAGGRGWKKLLDGSQASVAEHPQIDGRSEVSGQDGHHVSQDRKAFLVTQRIGESFVNPFKNARATLRVWFHSLGPPPSYFFYVFSVKSAEVALPQSFFSGQPMKSLHQGAQILNQGQQALRGFFYRTGVVANNVALIEALKFLCKGEIHFERV